MGHRPVVSVGFRRILGGILLSGAGVLGAQGALVHPSNQQWRGFHRQPAVTRPTSARPTKRDAFLPGQRVGRFHQRDVETLRPCPIVLFFHRSRGENRLFQGEGQRWPRIRRHERHHHAARPQIHRVMGKRQISCSRTQSGFCCRCCRSGQYPSFGAEVRWFDCEMGSNSWCAPHGQSGFCRHCGGGLGSGAKIGRFGCEIGGYHWSISLLHA